MARHRYVIDAATFEVEVHAHTGREADVTVNGKRYRVERAAEPALASPPAVAHTAPGRSRAARARGENAELRAPMAGLVLKLSVSEGQRLSAGDPVLVLDAMKMENAIRAPHAGVVERVAVREGESVLTGALLATIASG